MTSYNKHSLFLRSTGFFLIALIPLSARGQTENAPAPIPRSADPSAKELRKNAEARTEHMVSRELAEGQKFAETQLLPKSGSKAAGTVIFSKTKNGIQVVSTVTGVKPGKHGIHIHENGDCSAADASSAGAHFNPTQAPHSGPSDFTRHVGDLGNITANKDGSGILTLEIPEIKGFLDWSPIIGRSVVLHEGADDLKTQPSGDSGGRIACGVISAIENKNAAR